MPALVRRGGRRLAQVQENNKPVLIYSTFPTADEAERVGGALVDRRLAACVNIIPGMTSIYHWQGARQRDSETVMIIKTRAGLADTVVAETKAMHSYANPALVVLAAAGGSADYLAWIAAETTPTP
jgi:periplasmic divalent cation tolerance protein